MVQKHTHIFIYYIYIKQNEQSEKTFCGAKKKSLGHPFKSSQLNILLYVYQCKNRKKKKLINKIWYDFHNNKSCVTWMQILHTQKKKKKDSTWKILRYTIHHHLILGSLVSSTPIALSFTGWVVCREFTLNWSPRWR